MKTFKALLLTSMSAWLFAMIIFFPLLWLTYDLEEAADLSVRSSVMVALIFIVIALVFRRRLKYLDSGELAPPAFSDASYREFGIDVERFDFDHFRELIEESFVISGRSDNTLKFRRKFTFWSWGAGVFLHYDRDAGKIAVHYFPISGYTRHATRAVIKMDKSLEELIRCSINS